MNIQTACGLVLVAGLALTGCGGGSTDADAAAAQPEELQQTGIAAALAYIEEQRQLPSTDIDPQTLKQTLPAADDTIEPAPV